MYEIGRELYCQVASRLRGYLNDDNYFSGSICFRFGDVECRLQTSIIVYRRLIEDVDGLPRSIIDDVVPVWWEFHTATACGEVCNDFGFDILAAHLRD